MDSSGRHTIRIGEYKLPAEIRGGKLFDVASHIVISGHDETGAQIWEINGLATDKNDKPKRIGMPWDSTDTIKAYPTDYPVMGDKVDNQTIVVIGTPEEIEAYKNKARTSSIASMLRTSTTGSTRKTATV